MNASIRLASTNDAAQIQAIYAPNVLDTVISFEVQAPTIEEMSERIQQTVKHYPWLVLEMEDEIAGYAYASSHRTRAAYQWSVDVSVYTHPQYWRRGVGRALYDVLFRILRLQGYFNAYAGITLPNLASVGIHEAMGFRPVGVYHNVGYKFGAWYDVGWWQLALQDRALNPETPKSVQTLINSDDWQAALQDHLPLAQP